MSSNIKTAVNWKIVPTTDNTISLLHGERLEKQSTPIKAVKGLMVKTETGSIYQLLNQNKNPGIWELQLSQKRALQYHVLVNNNIL